MPRPTASTHSRAFAGARAHTALRVSCGALCCALIASSASADPHAHEHTHDEHEEIEEIVVTHSPLAHGRDELAIPIDRLERAEVLEELGSTLGDTLQRRPGVATTGFAQGASRPVIRGQDAFRSEIVENGLASQDVSRLSPDHGVPVNPLAIERIEIVRGPAALRYGGGAVAGVVNAITNTVPQVREDEVLRGEAYGAYGHNADERDLAIELEGGLGEDTAWRFDGLSRNAGDYRKPGGGRQAGTDVDTGSVSIGASRFGSRGRIGAAYTRLVNDYGIPEDEDVDIEMVTNRVRVEGELLELPRIEALRLRAVYTDYEHAEIAAGVVGQRFDNDEVELRLEALHEPFRGFRGALGLSGRYRKFVAGGEAAEFLSPTESNTVALYVFEERSLSDHTALEMGLRLESTQVEGTPRGAASSRVRSFVPVSGSLSLVADPFEGWTFGATAAASQRAPSAVELFARGPHEATGTFELGDADLDPETSFTGELRVQGRLGPFELEASPFATWYQAYVFGALTGNEVDEDGAPAPGAPDALQELRYSARDALFYGIELQLETELFDLGDSTLGMDASFDFVRGRLRDGTGDKDLPRITPIRWGAGVFYDRERFRIRLSFQRVEAQDDVAEGETRTGGYTMLNASFTYRLSLVEAVPVELFLIGRNLADQRARNHLALNKDQVVAPGVNIRAGLRAEF